jgi:hypothetical protein
LPATSNGGHESGLNETKDSPCAGYVPQLGDAKRC